MTIKDVSMAMFLELTAQQWMTLFTSIFAVSIPIIGIYIAWSRHSIAKISFERDTLLKVQDHAVSNEISNKFEMISLLSGYSTYEEFVKNTRKEDVRNIEMVVSHLNYCAQLVDENYLKRQLVWNRYFWMYKISSQKLGGWWLDHHQSIHANKFSNFEHMCELVSLVPDRIVEEFDKNRKVKRDEEIQKEAKLHTRQLRRMKL